MKCPDCNKEGFCLLYERKLAGQLLPVELKAWEKYPLFSSVDVLLRSIYVSSLFGIFQRHNKIQRALCMRNGKDLECNGGNIREWVRQEK